jgi:hypothetical protein
LSWAAAMRAGEIGLASFIVVRTSWRPVKTGAKRLRYRPPLAAW